MAQRPNLLPTTVCFSEIPTNPDMKVPDMAEVSAASRAQRKAAERSGKGWVGVGWVGWGGLSSLHNQSN